MIMLLYGMFMPLLSGVWMLAAGDFLILNNSLVLTLVSYAAALILPLRGVVSLIGRVIRREKISPVPVLLSAIEITISVFIFILPKVSFNSFIIFFEIYLNFLYTVKGVDTVIFFKNKQWGSFTPALVQTLLALQLFFFLIFCPPQLRNKIVSMGIGVLLNVYGIAQLCDFLMYISRNQKFQNVLSTIRIALPDFIAIFMPLRLCEPIIKKDSRQKSEEKQNSDLEVFFQVTDSGIGIAGHCELCYRGKTITYGNYNPETRRLFKTVGEGIILRAEKSNYLKWEIEANKKKVVSYRLSLAPKEIEQIEIAIAKLESCLEEWTPKKSIENKGDFADELAKQGSVKFYRIVKGRYKTYFVPTINCVSITRKLLENTRIGKPFMIGINTPGAYMHMLNRMYLSGSSTVVSRVIYG